MNIEYINALKCPFAGGGGSEGKRGTVKSILGG